MIRNPRPRRLAAISATSVIALTAVAGCSKSGGGSGTTPAPAANASVAASCKSAPSATPNPAANPVGFNQANLADLDKALKCALAGKDLSSVNIAMVVNVAAD